MDLFLIIITLLILTETTILVIKSSQKPLINNNQKRKIYVDTSALMDPRLVAVAETGFIGDDLVVPRSVLHELQLLADGKDHDKRIRARAGLDAVRELERVVYFTLTILDDELDHTPVDNRLLELAKNGRSVILTNDFNLKKVAAAEHIDAISLNELALVLRNEYLPGEHTRVKIVSVGSGANQGVAYLKDGTMVVVDQASKRVGEEAEVEFIRLNQTAAGSMMFAKLVPEVQSSSSKVTSSKSATKSSSTSSSKRPTRSTKASSVRRAPSAKTAQSSRDTSTQSSRPAQLSRTSIKPTSTRKTSRTSKTTAEDSLLALVSSQNSNDSNSK